MAKKETFRERILKAVKSRFKNDKSRSGHHTKYTAIVKLGKLYAKKNQNKMRKLRSSERIMPVQTQRSTESAAD